MAVDTTRCIESVSGSGSWGAFDSHQCTRKRVVGDYCKQHDPVAIKAKDAAREKEGIAYRTQSESIARRGEHLKKLLGVKAQVYYDIPHKGRGTYREALIISFSEIEALIDKLVGRGLA